VGYVKKGSFRIEIDQPRETLARLPLENVYEMMMVATFKTMAFNSDSTKLLFCVSLIVFSFVIGIFSPSLLYGKPLEIAIFIPREDPFWKKAVVFTEEAATDLGMKLRVYNANDDPDKMVEQVRKAARSGINGIIFLAYQNTGKRILQIAEKNSVPAILINSQLPQADLLPRTKYANWIGSVLPDDEKTGSVLIQQLVYEAAQNGVERFNVLAIEGNPKDESSIDRIRGLRNFMKHLKGVDSFKIVVGNWNRITAYEIFQGYNKIQPDVNIVWCANDNMALGVAKAIKELGLEEKIVVGGMDWDKAAQEEILSGRMDVSVGGHFMDGAWAAVLLYDYLNGIDFANERLQFESQMVGITRANLKKFSPFLSLDKQSLNFRLFSKVLNQQLKLYNLDLNAIANLITPQQITAELTEAEKAWLAEHKHIRLGVDPAWPPFEFFDITRVYSGIASDYVRFLNQKLNIKMVPVQDLSWSLVMDKVRASEIDVLPCVLKTPKRSKFLWFSKPYLSFPMVILTREDAPFISGVQDFEDNKVAVVRGYATQDLLEQDYPDRKFFLANNLEHALKALSKGQVDAYLGNLASITYTTQKLRLTNLKVATTAPYKFELAFAVRKDWPQLVNILNKSLESIPDSERAKIYNHWISVRFERGIDWVPIFQIVGVLVFVGGFIFIIIIRWNRVLSKEVTDRKRAEESLRESRATARGLLDATQESLLLLDKEGTIIAANQTAARRHQRTPEELIGTNRFDILPENVLESRKAHFRKVLQTGEPEDFEDVRDGMVFHHIYYPVQDKKGVIMGVAIFAQDITERKQAEEALRESEINMRTVFENSPLGMIHFSKDGTILDCNDMFVELMGSSREKLIGFNTPKQTNDEKLRAAIIKALAGETEEYEGDYTSVTGNKTTSLRIIFNPTEPGASPTEVIATLEDITERKRAEEAIRESQERLSTILKKTNQGFWLVDNNTITLDVNDAMCEILDRTKEEIIGRKIYDFLDEENRAKVRKQEQDRSESKRSLYEVSFMRSDGKRVPCLVNASPLLDADGDKIGSFGMFTDITERKEAEEAISESRERLDTILKTTAQGFWLNDQDDNMMEVNDAMCEILDLPKEEIVGSNFFNFLDEKNREIVREQNRVRKKGVHSLYEISLMRPDGQLIPCLMNASPLFDQDGNVAGSFGMTTNIAERKQMEEELRRNVDELERFSKVAFGREKKMIRLKQEINELMIQLGQGEKYKIVS
jgi:PAS domain S-box-containing protein